MVAAETLGHEGRGGAPENGRVVPAAPEGEPAQESRREGISTASRVHHLHRKGGNGLGGLGVDDHSAIRAAGGGDAADAPLNERAAAVDDVPLAGEAEHLLRVGQQVVELRQRRRDPLEQAGVARGQDVGGRDDALLARMREDPSRRLAAHELRPSEMQVPGGGDRVPGRVIGTVGAVGADDVECRPLAVGADRQHAG